MPAAYSNVANAAGLRFGVTTSVPDSHDTSGFDALTYTAIGGVLSTSLPRRTRSSSRDEYLDGTSGVVLGTEQMSDLENEVGWDTGDAGQTIIRNNDDGSTRLFWEWILPSTDTIWCAGYVSGFGATVSDSNSSVRGAFTISPQFDTSNVGEVLKVAT